MGNTLVKLPSAWVRFRPTHPQSRGGWLGSHPGYSERGPPFTLPQAGETRARVQYILNGRKIRWWASSCNPSISDVDETVNTIPGFPSQPNPQQHYG